MILSSFEHNNNNNIVKHQSNLPIDNNNNNISLCSICNNDFKTISDPESGEIICEICGIVLSEEKKLPLHTRVYEEMNANSHFNTQQQIQIYRIMIIIVVVTVTISC